MSIRDIWGESAQKIFDKIQQFGSTAVATKMGKPVVPEQLLSEIEQYLEEFKHLSNRLEMVADNCRGEHTKDSCNAIASLIMVNKDILTLKIREYLMVLAAQDIENELKCKHFRPPEE